MKFQSNTRILRSVLLSGVAAVLAFSAVPVSAQEQTGQRSGLMIEEIMVTARKREEALQDVPLSITAFNREQVERLNLSTLKDVAKFTPGLIFAEGLAPGDPRPSIRGQSNPRAASRPSVGIFTDGIPIGVGTGLNTQSLDIERIEVVKGPQSVQFGRDVLSGAVNYVTRRPSTEAIAGEVDALYGTGDRIDLKARVNIPINDVFAVSLAGRTYDFDGYYKTSATGVGMTPASTNVGIPLGTETADAFAASGIAQLGERGSVYLRASYSDENIGQTAWANTPSNRILGPGPANRWFFGTFPTNKSLLAINPIDYAGLDRQLFRSSLIVDYDFDAVTVQSTTAWNKSNILTDLDTDWTAFPDAPLFGTNLIGNLRNEFVREIEDYSQELRLSSQQDQRFRWMAGVYGFKEKISRKDFTRSFAAGSAAPRNRASVNRSRETTETLSGFGSLAFDITDSFTVTGEVRYTRDKLAVNNPALVIPILNASFKKWLPRVTVEYKVTDSILLYANAGKGNKPGGFNTAAGAGLGQLPANLLAFQEEQAWQYEIGAKTSWLDDRVTLNAAAFYTDWSNLVVNAQFVTATGTNIGYAANAGTAKVEGFEIELRAQPLEWLDVYGGVSYAPSRLDNYADTRITGAFGPTAIPTTDRRLPFVSDWTGSAGFIATVPITDTWNVFLQTDAAYRSKQYATVANVDNVGSRVVADVKLGLQHENYTLTFLVNNVFNNDRADSADAFVVPRSLPFERSFLVQLPAPRNYGIRLQAKF
jgi:iron complex outermembrane receptor protein